MIDAFRYRLAGATGRWPSVIHGMPAPFARLPGPLGLWNMPCSPAESLVSDDLGLPDFVEHGHFISHNGWAPVSDTVSFDELPGQLTPPQPQFLMVPLNGTRYVKSLWPPTRALYLPHQHIKVTPMGNDVGGYPIYRIDGVSEGLETLYAVRQTKKSFVCHGELNISVKPLRTYQLDVRFLRFVDDEGHPNRTTRVTRLDVVNILKVTNDYFRARANVEFRLHQPHLSFEDRVITYIGPGAPIRPEHRAGILEENRTGSSLIRLIFGWEFADQPGVNAEGTANRAMRSCIVEDTNLARIANRSLPHELMHILTYGHDAQMGYDGGGHSPREEDLMYKALLVPDANGTLQLSDRRLRKPEINLINPGGRF